MTLPRLNGRVALVTGAASGIGRATAVRLAQDGAAVLLVTDQNLLGLAETAGMVEAIGGRAMTRQADVSVESDIAATIAGTIEAYGRLDCLVNNAAYGGETAGATEAEVDDWDRVMAVGLRGVMLGLKHGIPAMLATAGAGSIVNVSSINSFIHAPGLAAYSAMKGGVDALTRQTALEFGPRGIRVNAVNPGLIAVETELAWLGADPEAARLNAECYPLGRIGRPEEVAAAIAFLLSDDASFVTGVTMPIDGGISIQSAAAIVSPRLRSRWRSGSLRLE